MSDFTPDLVGFAGSRTITKSAATGQSRANMTTTIINAMDAEWSVIEAASSGTHGTEKKWRSTQSPWYSNNIPSWYVGGQATLELDQSNITFIILKLREWYNGAEVTTVIKSFNIRVTQYTSGEDFYCLVNPFQATWFPGSAQEDSNNELQGFVSVLNIPKTVLQKEKVISRIVGGYIFPDTARLFLEDAGSVSRKKDETPIYATAKNPVFLTVAGGNFVKRLWNRADNLSMADPGDDFPFLVPSCLAWDFDNTGVGRYGGFIWDGFTITEPFTRLATVTLATKEYVNIGGVQEDNSSPQRDVSLFLNFDDAGETLP